MKAFRFRLDGLLHVAQSESEERRRDLLEANAALLCGQERAEAAAQEREAAEDAWRTASAGAVPLTDWLVRQSEAEMHRRTEVAAGEAVQEGRRAVDGRQADYLTARRDERRLDQLRARQQHRWAVENARRDQQSLDDIAGALRGRRGQGGDAPA